MGAQTRVRWSSTFFATIYLGNFNVLLKNPSTDVPEFHYRRLRLLTLMLTISDEIEKRRTKDQSIVIFCPNVGDENEQSCLIIAKTFG